MTEVRPVGGETGEGELEGSHVRSRWHYIRMKLKHRGVVQVDSSHPHYTTLCCLKEGIRQTLADHTDEHYAKDTLVDTDYSHVLTKTVKTKDGKTAVFESYASTVFASVRRAVDISEEDYFHSLAPPDLPYMEFLSNSRSGQDFYFSNNQRFILKTDKPKCIDFFLQKLREYLDHFLTYPHSLLVKYLGLYSIKVSGGSKRFMLVMQSIFYPTTRLQDRFDIKGCLSNRYQKPNPPGKTTMLVLKDQNFLHEKIDLGNQRGWFLRQLKDDVDFLKTLGVQDYSLLLGRHPLHVSDQRETVRNLVVRMRKSFGNSPGDPTVKIVANIEGEISEETVHTEITSPSRTEFTSLGDTEVASPVNGSQFEPQCRTSALGETEEMSDRPSMLRSFSDATYLDSTGLQFENRRLLLNCHNNLHIIDGNSHRYFVGVIDFFTQWRCRQRVARVIKDIKFCCRDHSTEPPHIYADRFYNFIVDHTV